MQKHNLARKLVLLQQFEAFDDSKEAVHKRVGEPCISQRAHLSTQCETSRNISLQNMKPVGMFQ
jgi:hypothetical protein